MKYYILNDPRRELKREEKFIWIEETRECRKITRKQLTHLLHRIYNSVKIRVYITPWLHPWAAWNCYWYLGENHRDKTGYVYMYLNPRRSTVKAYLHENLHILYSSSPEGEILAMEEQMCRMMSTSQWHRLRLSMDKKIAASPKRTPAQLMDMFITWDDEVKRLLKRQRTEFRKGKIVKEYLKERLNERK